jgi:hypothetical protein
MRYLLVTAIAALTCSAVSAEDTGRFAPGVPWYQDFERDCRQDDPGDPMDDNCEKGVEQAWRNFSGSENVKCDYGAFWLVSDDKKQHDQYFAVLPWQYGVEYILQEGGVCRVVAE